MMKSTTLIRALYSYNAWANERILHAAGQLTRPQFESGAAGSYDTVRGCLLHILTGQWLWLSRWQGDSPRALLDPADFATLAAIQAHWQVVERDSRIFIAELKESDLDRQVDYRTTAGEPCRQTLWHLLLHQVNHATQHRSEAAVMLTRLGHSPGDLDMLYYFESPTGQYDKT
jgi:uncharacterized damage-inducible protein DinB